ncbi:MAG TPA: FliG C-terminal domain-containing protein [Spirochaetia bacterium]|nr:FliG C-terminal domain-containing protein [Spirochaetia bacterium]
MDLNKRRIGAYRKFSGPGRTSGDEDAVDPKSAPTEQDGASPARTPRNRAAGGSRKSGAPEPGMAKKSRSGAVSKALGLPENALIRLTEDGASGSGRRRVAELLLLLGKDEAAGVLKHLDPQTIETVTAEIAAMGRLGKKEAASVLSEFGVSVRSGAAGRAGGIDTARQMLSAAFGEAEAEKLLLRVVPEAAPKVLDFLNDLEPQQIQLLLRHESAPVISIVVAHLDPPIAAQVVSALPPKLRQEVVRRIVRLQKVDREVIASIEASLREKIRASGKVVSSEIDGKTVLAQILRHLAPQDGEHLLDQLGRDSPELSADIRDRLFTIDTLLLIEDIDLQHVLQQFPDEEIALVLKGKTEEIRGKVLKNVSDRRRSFIMDEYQRLGALPRRDVDKATREFIAILKAMESEGKIVVRRPDERYV